ncbi:MAG: FAD-dependent oxidoreductase [Eubacterium sp.]|nr:FAD-dependent oxidoreductase [Eubacterium sp.]
MKYKHLLTPLKVGNKIIKNRMSYPNASPHFLQGPEDYPAEGYRAFVSNLARNGAAIIDLAEWDNPDQRKGPMDMDMTHMQSFDMTNPAVHNYQAQLAEEVHFFDSKVFVSMQEKMPAGYSMDGGRFPMGPNGKPTEILPTERVKEAVDLCVEACRTYKLLGFDGLTVRVDNELIKKPNPRTDMYSGDSIENRTRFTHEWFAAVKKAFGGDFLIKAVIAWEQPDGYGPFTRPGGGYTEKEAEEFIELFDDVVDILEIRESDVCKSHPTGYTMKEDVHPAVDFAAKMKAKGVKMLMAPIGGFQSPDEMEKILAEGKCDMFVLARGFMADYDLGDKIKKGLGEDVVPCIKCNKCHGTILPEHEPWISVCSVNPLMGKSGKIHRMTANLTHEPKKVAVIGGGPTGMRAALYAAGLGHDVTIFEKTDSLGGQLFHSDYFSFKWPVKNYKNWLIREVQKNDKIKILLNTEPSPSDIEKGGFEAVLAATGAKASLPKSIEGIADENGNAKEGVYTCLDAIPKEKELGKDIVICGGSEVGMETAMFLCENGHNVTVLTRQNELGHNCSKLHYITMAWIKITDDGRAVESPAWEKYENLKGIVSVTTKKVDGNTVYYEDADGNEHKITADNVLICGGMKPLTDEALSYAASTPEFYAIGDCNGAGNLQICNEHAYSRAMLI